MKLTDEQIVKLIADAFRVGRNEGMEVGARDGYENGLRDGAAEEYERGYEEGWDRGWEKGYDSGKADAEDNAAEEDSDARNGGCYGEGWDKAGEDACKCVQCMNPEVYDMGWNDGFNGRGVDLDMASNEAYMQGFSNGHDDREFSYNGEVSDENRI